MVSEISRKSVVSIAHEKTGGGFAVAMGLAYYETLYAILSDLHASGKDVAILVVAYSLTPHAVYPTQVKQAVAALCYVLQDRNHPPSNTFIGGDSAGGNLVFAVLSHISHTHPEIEPLELSEPLGGAVAIAPWASFSQDYVSMKENVNKDMLTPGTLRMWSDMYMAGQKEDNYNQPLLAPVDWWSGLMVKDIFVVAGSDELLLGGIQEFLKKLKVSSSPSVLTWKRTNAERD